MNSSVRFLLRQRQDDLESDLSDYVSARWLRYVKSAELAAESCGDPEIANELATLKDEWDALTTARNHVGAATAQSDDRGDVSRTVGNKRAPGRPKGSGSYK